MQTFTGKQMPAQTTKPANSAAPERPFSSPNPNQRVILHLQSIIGNQAIQRLLQKKIEARHMDSATAAVSTSLVQGYSETISQKITRVSPWDGNSSYVQRWAFPTDWLDYIGLGIDVVERVYIELAYEEGEEKDFQRFVNTLFFAIDLVLAALPGAGGGGLAIRGSRQLAIAGWGAVPESAKLQIAAEVARQMGWSVTRATQMINAFFRSSTSATEAGNERRNVESHESAGGHTGERHVGRPESWLRKRLESEPDLEFASSFRNEEAANRTQGRFVRRFREEIETWLQSGEARFVREFDMEQPIGIVLERGSGRAVETSRARLILIRDSSSHGWHFLTSFPIP